MTTENIRAEYSAWCKELYMTYCDYPEVADFFLAKFAARDAEVRAGILGMRKREVGAQTGTGFKMNNKAIIYNQALTDVLALFDQVRVKV